MSTDEPTPEEMIRQETILYHPHTGEKISTPSDGWYGMRASAYDSGDPEKILDVIEAESLVDSIQDHTVKAAVILHMHGFTAEQLTSILRSHHTGSELIDRGIDAIRQSRA